MHSVIVGRTETGKTTLAKKLGRALVDRGQIVIAYNPLGDGAFTKPDEHGAVASRGEFVNVGDFMREAHRELLSSKAQPVFLIIDEATTFFEKVNCDRAWLATRGRHHGVNLILICQHFTRLNPEVRGQCPVLYLFACGLTTASVCADEYGHKELAEAPQLKPGHYYRRDPNGLTKGRVFG